MGRWTVKTKVTETIKRISPFPTLLNRISQPLQFSVYDGNIKQKHPHSFNGIESSVLTPRVSRRLVHISSCIGHAFQPFDKMPQRENIFENAHSLYVLDLIRHCTHDPNAVNVEALHALALKVGALAHLPIPTSLLVLYSRAGGFSCSVALFDEILHKDVVVCNAMMTGFIDNGFYEAAANLFLEMMVENGFDSATLVIVVSALSKMNNLIQGQVIHVLSIKAGMLFDSFLCNALIDMYAKCGDLRSSECMFKGVEHKDLVSWNSIVSGCLYNDRHAEALWYFKKMASYGERWDNVSLSCAIAASTCLGDFCIGKVIHGLGIKLGCEGNFHISFSNSLISFYCHSGDIDAAYNVFRTMSLKDVISWNAMIDGFYLNGMTSKALDHLQEMQLGGKIQPDTMTIITVSSLCAEAMLLGEVKALHGFTIRRALELDLSVMNSLIDMYSKGGCVNAAEDIFGKTMQERDLISWNTMISGYSQNGFSREAQALFKKLLSWCSWCTLSTLLAILPACDSVESLQFGTSIHCWQLKLGFLNNVLSANSLIFMYISCGDFLASLSLLLVISSFADTSSWNTVISGCTQNGQFREALETFNLMRHESNVNLDGITLVNVISACGNLELMIGGKLIHGLAFKTSALDTRVQNALITMYGRFQDTESANLVFEFVENRNLCTWNCMISVFSQNKGAKKALELFRGLDFEPNEITIAALLSACTQVGDLRSGKQIQGRVFRFGFYRNSFISSALLDMYSNCGRLDMTLIIFRNLQEKSVASWNSMISAYGFHSNGQKAINLFNRMIESGISPTKTTFINLLSACSHSGLVNEGLWYYYRMLYEYGVEPVTEHHVCIVDMLGRSGRLSEAYEFIKQMPNRPESGIWGALLSACNYHGDIELGREVAEKLFDLDPENVGYYVSLFNMYVAAGRWDDAVEVRSIIGDKKLKKTAGYSLIDVRLG